MAELGGRHGGDWDVVVVGAGSAGCPLAARLADAGRRVLLLEAGADHPPPGDLRAELRDPGRLAGAAPGHPANWDLPAELTDAVAARVPRGRVLGGSSAINGAVFVRGTPADFDRYAAAGNDLWSAAAVLPAFCRLEADRQFGDRPGHGSGGPVPVTRPPAGHPLAEAFAAATAELGFPAEPDKNAGGEPGCGPLPFTVDGGVRVDAATAYLSPRRGAPGLAVRGGVRVHRVLVEGGRAVGVATDAGPVRAAEVVLSAGAVGSPQLLLLSGIGPADRLRALGIPVVADSPGVGEAFSDHAHVHVPWTPRPGLAGAPPGWPPLHSALHTGEDLGVELLPWLAPFGAVVPRPGAAADPAEPLTLGVGLQRQDSRGRLSLRSADPGAPPWLEYRYLRTGADRRRLREGVRLAARVLRAPPLAQLRTGDLPGVLDAGDAELDAWVAATVTTAVHLAGSARMGPDGDPGAVVDQRLRVRGVPGLRVVDTSVLPETTSRGTAATALMIGERAAELMTGEGA